MPRAHQCSFCGGEVPPGTGIMYVKTDGSTLWFCSSKCRKNALELRRDSRKLKWTKYYQKEERAKI
jgi:large subunit ribosomal protein L24e